MNALFGDDSDDDVALSTPSQEYSDGHKAIWLELMKLKPSLKKREAGGLVGVASELVMHRVVALVGGGPDLNAAPAELSERLTKSGFVFTWHATLEAAAAAEPQVDVLVLLNASQLASRSNADRVHAMVVAGGSLLVSLLPGAADTAEASAHVSVLCLEDEWAAPRVQAGGGAGPNSTVLAYKRRSVRCNQQGAVYWGATSACAQLEAEKALLESVSVPLSVQEQRLGTLGDESHRKAVAALQRHGLCVLPGLFPAEDVLQWGAAAREDMVEILARMRQRGIDLLRPGAGPRIENFHELSMREALRCDIRNGRRIKAAAAAAVTGAGFADLRRHPAVHAVLLELMNPPGDPTDAKGNWGRWNFEGAGPEGPPPPLAVGQVGAVMSLPGCADQTIHADTAHLYVHAQLPGHYVNLFLPAVSPADGSDAFEVGQTAYVCGTHLLSVSAKVMTQEGGQEALNARLVRPHLRAGDGLLFDCRILHFGLANQSKPGGTRAGAGTGRGADIPGATRPLLYINFHQPWFVDPKNWTDRDMLFPEENGAIDSPNPNPDPNPNREENGAIDSI